MRCFLCPKLLPKRLQVHPRYRKNTINKPQFYCELDWQRAGRPLPERIIEKKFKEDLSDLVDKGTINRVKLKD